jgi:uncharacterized protein YdhG (YjbR/CyaY superfamily)
MSKQEIDDYLASLPEPKKGTLEELRKLILEAAPNAEQCISYGMPAFKENGKVIAGFAAFKNHLAYLPHSGSVLSEISDELGDYTFTPGSLHFAVDKCLDEKLVRLLVETKRAMITKA